MTQTAVTKTHTVQPTGPQREFTTRKGRPVVTRFTDQEAYTACGQLKGLSFALELAHHEFYRLSTEQMIWCHILAVDNAPAGARDVKPLGDVSGILAMFEKASAKLKTPGLLLRTADGIDVKLFVASARAQYPGEIYVYETAYAGRRFGRIDGEGRYIASEISTESITALLVRLSERPEETAAEYGRLTGRCCFCNSDLTDERSTSVGYGPTCAKNYGLAFPTFTQARSARLVRGGQATLAAA